MKVNTENKNVVQRFMELVIRALDGDDEAVEEHPQRDLQVSSLYYAVEAELMNDYEYPWVVDFMFNAESAYMIFTSGGKLYRADFSVNADDTVAIDQVREVKLDYPVIEQSRMKPVFRTMRDADGKLLFLAIAASTVLNRVGQIDSTKLFDDFEEEFGERDAPYLTLQHLPQYASFGTVKGVFRRESLLIIYGEIDEETTLGRVAEERFATGEWGISIGFMATEEPEMELIGGVEIPVFNKGYLVEASVLKEDRAASYFTTISSVSKEIRQMGKSLEAAKQLLIEFAGEAAEDEVDAILEEANVRERVISDEGMITREAEDEEEVVEEEEQVEAEETPTPTETDPVEYEVDADFIEELATMAADKVSKRLDEALEGIKRFETEIRSELTEIREFVARVNEAVSEVERNNNSFGERLADVEQEEGKKVREAVNDTPAAKHRKVTVMHRPTEKDDDGEVKRKPLSLAEVANSTLDNVGLERDKFENPK